MCEVTGGELYLHPVIPGVEQARASDIGQDGVCAVLQHVVSGDWRQAVSLQREGDPAVSARVKNHKLPNIKCIKKIEAHALGLQ